MGPKPYRERHWDLLRMAEDGGGYRRHVCPQVLRDCFLFFGLQKVALGVAGGRESLFECDF